VWLFRFGNVKLRPTTDWTPDLTCSPLYVESERGLFRGMTLACFPFLLTLCPFRPPIVAAFGLAYARTTGPRLKKVTAAHLRSTQALQSIRLRLLLNWLHLGVLLEGCTAIVLFIANADHRT